MSKITSPKQAVDDALKSTCRILATIFLPAFLATIYRNLYVNYLPPIFHMHNDHLLWICCSFIQFYQKHSSKIIFACGSFLSVLIFRISKWQFFKRRHVADFCGLYTGIQNFLFLDSYYLDIGHLTFVISVKRFGAIPLRAFLGSPYSPYFFSINWLRCI